MPANHLSAPLQGPAFHGSLNLPPILLLIDQVVLKSRLRHCCVFVGMPDRQAAPMMRSVTDPTDYTGFFPPPFRMTFLFSKRLNLDVARHIGLKYPFDLIRYCGGVSKRIRTGRAPAGHRARPERAEQPLIVRFPASAYTRRRHRHPPFACYKLIEQNPAYC